MNLLSRTKPSAKMISSFASPRNRFFCAHPISAFHQSNSYSTKTTHSSPNSQQLTKPKTQRSSGPSLSFSQKIKKQTEELTTVWPKPSEIPYQAKVSNFVNLIGYVKIPVHFESSSDGKHFATTVISLGNVGVKSTLYIPVVFEGDLAHVVACHVKESDRVFVSGQLSVEPMRLVLSESLGKFHVVAENVNFVEGFDRNVVNKKIGVSISSVEIDKPGKHGVKMIDEVLESDSNQHVRVVSNDSKSVESPVKLFSNADEHGIESKPEKGNEKIPEGGVKKKDGDQILDLWRDLVKNPLQWWDYRNHKAQGLVKEKFPDFKQKMTGESLWLSSAPKWVLPGIGKLEFDVKDAMPKQVVPSERQQKYVKNDDSWKSLVENPDEWWDNRIKKKNPKAPDFKHKETGEVLWLNSSPVWAVSKLPPIRDA